MKKKYAHVLRRSLLLLLLPVLSVPLSLIGSVLPVAAAATTYANMSISDQIKTWSAWQYLNGNGVCEPQQTIKNGDITSYHIYSSTPNRAANSSQISSDCSDQGGFVENGLKTFGLSTSDSEQLLCTLGYKQAESKTTGSSPCPASGIKKGQQDDVFVLSGTTSSSTAAQVATAFSKALLQATKSVLGGSAPSLSKAANYYATLSDFQNLCSATPTSSPSSTGRTANLPIVGDASNPSKVTTQVYTYTNNVDIGAELTLSGGLTSSQFAPGMEANQTSCAGLAAVLGDTATAAKPWPWQSYFDAYQIYLVGQQCATAPAPIAGNAKLIAACKAGASNASNIKFCALTYPDGYVGSVDFGNQKAERVACYAGQGNGSAEDCVTALTADGIAVYNSNGTASGALQACINGSNNADDPNYCTVAYGHPGDTAASDPILSACEKGVTFASNADNLGAGNGSTCPNGATNPPICDECPNGTSLNDASTCGANASSCNLTAASGWGWMICLAGSFLATATDGIYSTIAQIVSIPPLDSANVSTGNDGIYNAWNIIRDVANVLFVIAFLIIIFSQLTGLGVTNYGVKKTLPRLIIAAILVNISYWVAALAVDVSNILGSGLFSLLVSIRGQMGVTIDNTTAFATVLSALLSGGAAGVVATGAAAAGVGVAIAALTAAAPEALLAAVLFMIPLLLAALLAVVAVVVILIARIALTYLLIIIAPLAFVALLLPNTEKLFTRWRQTLTTLLAAYPIVTVVFGGSQIAGLAILSTLNNQTAGLAAGGATIADASKIPLLGLTLFAGLFAEVLPLFFIIPLIIRFSGGNLDKLAGQIRSRGQKLLEPINKAARGGAKTFGGLATDKVKFAPRRSNGISNLVGGAGRAVDQMRYKEELQKQEGQRLKKKANVTRLANDARFAQSAALGNEAAGARLSENARLGLRDEERQEATKAFKADLARRQATQKDFNLDEFLHRRATGLNDDGTAGTFTDAERYAAISEAGEQGRDKVIRSLGRGKDMSGKVLTAEQTAGLAEMVQEAKAANAGKLGTVAPDTLKGDSAAFDNAKGGDVVAFKPGTGEAQMEYIASLPDKISSLQQEARAAGLTPEQRAKADKAVADAQQSLDAAVNAFNSSTLDISNSDTYQAQFGADLGMAYVNTYDKINSAAATTRATKEALARLTGMSRIARDGEDKGKIRKVSDGTPPPDGGTASPDADFAVPHDDTAPTPSAPAAADTVDPGEAAGLYRRNSVGTAIRPAGSSSNSGAPLTAEAKAQLDARAPELTIDHNAQQAAHDAGATPEQAQQAGEDAYRDAGGQ